MNFKVMSKLSVSSEDTMKDYLVLAYQHPLYRMENLHSRLFFIPLLFDTESHVYH